MARKVPTDVPSDPALLSTEFGGREDALREFEERLEVVRRDLERAFALRDHRAAATQEARQAVATLTEKAHAADGTNPDAAAKYRAHRQRKRTAFEESRRELQKAQAACDRLGAERTQLEHNIAKLMKLRVRERRRRLWDRLRGIHDEDDTGAKANVHVPAYLIALGVGLALLLGFMAIRYQSRGPAEEDAPGLVTRVARLLGFGEEGASDLTQEESTAAASAAMKQMFGLKDPQPRVPPAQRLPVATVRELAQVNLVTIPWADDMEAYALPGRTLKIVVSDVTGDATPEVVFADLENRRIVIYERRPEGGYALVHARDLDIGVQSVAAGDMDGDGATDLIAGNWRGGLWYLPNRGAKSFEPQVLSRELRPIEIHVGDLDGNGSLDIVVGGRRGVHVCAGRGDGTFADPVRVLRAADQGRLLVMDFNDDGIQDVASLTAFGWRRPPQSNELSVVLLNQDLEPVEPPKTRRFSPPAWSMAAIDLDGGTGIDLAVMEHGDSGKRRLFSLWNSGTGRFDVAGAEKVQYGTGMAVDDFDQDDRDDLLLGSFLYRVQGNRLVGGRQPFARVSPQWSTRVDFDNDGVMDTVMNVTPQGTLLFLRGQAET